jgi:hypothetical protein
MNRNISIIIDPSQEKNDYIHINNISSIINYSCDSIIINCLEYLMEKDHNIIIKMLLDKLRPYGKLIISINNAHNIAQNFINRSISNNDFLKFFSNKQSLLSLESLYSYIDFNYFELINLDINEQFYIITLEKKNEQHTM